MPPLAMFLRHWMPRIDFVAVAVLILWAIAPPSAIPQAPAAAEVYLPPLILLLLFGGTLAGVVLGRAREALPWAALAVVSVPLALELLFVWTWVTFPAGF